jgi:hypothetical protein
MVLESGKDRVYMTSHIHAYIADMNSKAIRRNIMERVRTYVRKMYR